MRRPRLADLGPALENRDFRLWWLGSLGMNLSLQMLEVAIGWEVYAQHDSPLDLGWIGLAEFVPMFVLAIPAGHLADRLPRRLVFAFALVAGAAVGLGLAALSASAVTSVLPYLALAAGAGVVMATGTPAARAMPPALVPADLLPGAMTLRSIAGQSAMVLGPAAGGVLYGVSPVLVYLLAAAMCLLASAAVVMITAGPAAAPGRPEPQPAPGFGSVLEGLVFVRRTQILLGAILLDLLAVLFGGAVALLPVFARSILHAGPEGLGILRAAPAVGALLAAALLTRRPLLRRAGRLLLAVVGIYGASIVVFGLSRVFWLSLTMLAVGGFADMFSMNIRSTTSALATPDRLRGRVSAVEMVFVSASNQLGAFESGVAASLAGTVPAVVGGGLITIGIALAWSRLFPALARIDRLQEVRPAEPTRTPVKPAASL
ncbi:MAG TPA: MFS transporter [Streptosporangiaceae bacterium]|nr:MFS transporter [Streptosporangiaceae bacterium]